MLICFSDFIGKILFLYCFVLFIFVINEEIIITEHISLRRIELKFTDWGSWSSQPGQLCSSSGLTIQSGKTTSTNNHHHYYCDCLGCLSHSEGQSTNKVETEKIGDIEIIKNVALFDRSKSSPTSQVNTLPLLSCLYEG